jgi:hypothetical protein
MILTGENRRTRRKTCPSATLSTTNPTRIDQGTNPGLRGERPVTNRLSHGMAQHATDVLQQISVSFISNYSFKLLDHILSNFYRARIVLVQMMGLIQFACIR